MDVFTTSIVLGGVVGVLLSLTGAGGGIISVPLLVFVLDMSIAEAAPIGLLSIMLAASIAAILGMRAGIVRYKAASLIAASGTVFFPPGLWLAQRVPNTQLTAIFACVLIYVAFRMFRHASNNANTPENSNSQPLTPCQIDQTRGKLTWTAPCARSIMISGATSGFLSGLLGVGGGFVIVPALRSLTNLDIKSIMATSLTSIALVSFSGVAIAASQGLVNWKHAWPFAVGACMGMLLGRLVGNRTAGHHLQRYFAAFAFIVGVVMLGRTILSAVH